MHTVAAGLARAEGDGLTETCLDHGDVVGPIADGQAAGAGPRHFPPRGAQQTPHPGHRIPVALLWLRRLCLLRLGAMPLTSLHGQERSTCEAWHGGPVACLLEVVLAGEAAATLSRSCRGFASRQTQMLPQTCPDDASFQDTGTGAAQVPGPAYGHHSTLFAAGSHARYGALTCALRKIKMGQNCYRPEHPAGAPARRRTRSAP